jgi:hypothetical protein
MVVGVDVGYFYFTLIASSVLILQARIPPSLKLYVNDRLPVRLSACQFFTALMSGISATVRVLSGLLLFVILRPGCISLSHRE